ncbi:MAG: sulfate transporter CysZ [Gammaproteobacteria bacterium]|nr:sulfate transporter CysZ [Gammaproteobacteria bacterium]MBU1654963.1 sulfate transporter CysZ [Gammaproteobacteria bacterium]MBU1960071.1 sulfate transporter CysZ [Gammaproteobacteria bacterium]
MAIKEPLSGFGCALAGLRLVLKPELRHFVLIPFLINLLVFSGLIWLGLTQFEGLMGWLLPAEGWFSYLRWLLWPLFALAAVLIVFYSFTAFANLIAAPFNALLAEKVEIHLTGRRPPQNGPLWKEALPSLLSELRKMLYFLLRAIPLLILFLIPGVNLAAPFLWLLFNAWFLALEYGGYPMGNHGIRFSDQLRRLKAQRLNSLGFGAGVTLLMLIPLLNFLAMPAAVAGATLLWVRSERD